MDHLRARATSVDADSMPELGHGLCKPWHWPWSGRRPCGRSGNRLSCVGRFFRFRPLLSDLELQQAPRGRMTRGISSAKLATTGFPGSGTRRTLSALDARGTESSVHGSTESSREVSARGITTMCGLYSCVTSSPLPRGTRDAHRTTALVHYRRPNLTS